MKRSWWSIYRGFVQISVKEYLRDPLPTVFTLLMPLLFLVIFGVTFVVAGPDQSAPSPVYKVGIVSSARNPWAKRVEAKIDSLRAFEALAVDPTLPTAELEKKDIYMVVRVPDRQSEPVTIQYATPMAALAEIAAAQVQGAQASDVVLPEVRMVEQSKAEPKSQGGYITFIMPALIAFALVQLCLYGTATPLVAAKERGLMRHYAVMPVPRSALLAAQVTVRIFIAALQVGLMILLSVTVLHMVINGSMLVLIGVCLLGAVMLVSLGYALGGWFSSLGIATAVIAMLNLYVMAFGQIFVDLSAFSAAEVFLFTTPVAFLSDAIRQTVTGNAGAFPMFFNIAVIALWTAGAVFVGLKTFNFKIAEQ